MIIRCWDTRAQSYPTSASKIKSINCSAWPFQYFLFTANGWNFCDTFLIPWTKRTFLFFKILIRYWDKGVQSYLTSACKIFGAARKRRISAEKCSCRSTKKANVFKAKNWSKRGYQLPQPAALITSTDNSWPPPLSFHTSSKITQLNIFTLFICLCVRECVCVCVCVCVWMSQCVSVCVCLSMWVSVFVRVRHVGKVWICSAEEFLELCGKVEAVIRNCLLRWSGHLVEVAGTGTPFSTSLYALNVLAFFVMMSHVDKAWIYSTEEFLEL